MQFFLPFSIPPFDQKISHSGKVLLTGSCFTENIGNWMQDMKFDVLQNPNGILFNPMSVCRSLRSYIAPRKYTAEDIVYLNEGWHSWQHHSRFSAASQHQILERINASQDAAHSFLQQADWLIITLGSAFVYYLQEGGIPVANCHKAPAQQFQRRMLSIAEIISELDVTIHQLFQYNPALKIVFTISPVRHAREGLTDNNRSKARLIEAVHHLVHKFSNLYYFPAYELVVDVLRDYRFYDIDLLHPNYAATGFVIEQFRKTCLSNTSDLLCDDIKKLVTAYRHKPFHPASRAHQRFRSEQLEKAKQLQAAYPHIDFSKEISFFSATD